MFTTFVRRYWIIKNTRDLLHPVYDMQTLNRSIRADGLAKTAKIRARYEKPHLKRIRKKGESDIRRANEKAGILLNHILRMKNSYV